MAKRPTKKPDDAPIAVRDPRWADDSFWFKDPIGKPIHEKVVSHGKALAALYSTAHHIDRVHERLYDGTELRRHKGALAALSAHGFRLARLNASKAIINTLVSRLSKDRPMPDFLVNDADWSLKRKAKQYRKFLLGEMLETEFDERSKEALQDGFIIGNGITRIDDTGDGDKVFAERMLREELLYDPRECRYGKPPNAIRIHRIARDHLIDLYPAFASQIINAESSRRRPYEELDDDVNKIGDFDAYTDVYEAIHLPRCQGDDGGRRAYCITNATIIHEKWEEPRFPWCMFRREKPRRGVWSKGLIFELKDLQHRVNCIVRDMQMNLQATGRGHYLMQEGSEMPADLLTGWTPFTVKYKGARAPEWNAPQPFNQAQLGALQYFIQLMHDLSGVSQAAATSKSALGAGASGIALDTQYDIDSERFGMEQGQYAAYRMDAAQLYIDASKRVARKRAAQAGTKKPSAYVTSWLYRDAIERLDHDKVSLETDQYKLRIEPVGYLPSTRSGKLSEVGQLLQAGVIPQWLAAAVFDEPDLARSNRILLGAFWNAERKMELMAMTNAELAESGKQLPMPAPYNDYDLEEKMTVAYINNAEAEGAPDEVLSHYRDYLALLEDAKKTKQAAMAPPPMPPGPGGGPADMPGAAPMLPPGAPMPGGPGAPPPPGGMPAFGDGGVVTHPTVALIGEKGPEVVVPLGDAKTTVSNYLSNKYGYSPATASRHADFYLSHSDPNSKAMIAAAHKDQVARDSDPYGNAPSQQGVAAPVQFGASAPVPVGIAPGTPWGFQQGFVAGRDTPIPAPQAPQYAGPIDYGNPHDAGAAMQPVILPPGVAQGFAPFTEAPVMTPDGQIVPRASWAPPAPMIASK